MRTRTIVLVAAVLAVALGGTAVAGRYIITSTKQIKPSVRKALKGKRGPRGLTGPTGVPGAPGAPGAAAVSLWATVDGGGTVLRGSGATGASRPPGRQPGSFLVTFDRDVSQCGRLATITDTQMSVVGMVRTSLENPMTVFVGTYDSQGVPSPLTFTVAVVC